MTYTIKNIDYISLKKLKNRRGESVILQKLGNYKNINQNILKIGGDFMEELKFESKVNYTKNKKRVATSIHQVKEISKKDYDFLTDCIETFYIKMKEV